MISVDSLKSMQLLSWIDVARRLSYVTLSTTSESPPNGLVSTETYWSGLTVRVNENVPESEILDWLKAIFGSWLVMDSSAERYIRLSSPESMSHLPVRIVQVPDEASTLTVFKPHASLESERYFQVKFPGRPAVSDPPLYAFHSVKGGVGRTTASIAFAYDRSVNGGRVLLVDADFEAPGISFLTGTRKREPSISLEDLLALAHADRSTDFSESLDFVATRMGDQKIDNLFVLPAKRLLDDLTGFAIRPENLLDARVGKPYVVVDLIRDLAKRLQCHMVVVDLRAGLVDVATQFMTDPSVERVLVATTGGQSLAALESMISTLGLIEKQTGVSGRQPFVLVNQVPFAKLMEAGFRAQVMGDLGTCADKSFLLDPAGVETSSASLAFGFMPYLPDLISSSTDWDTYVTLLSASQFSAMLAKQMESWQGLDALSTSRLQEPIPPIRITEDTERCRLLQVYSEGMEVAETAPASTRPLITPPLQRLVSDFVSQVPIVIIEGAKGSGKTLTYRYFLEKGDWKGIVRDLSEDVTCDFDGSFIPLFGSVASGDAILELVRKSRDAISLKMGGRSPSSFSETEQNLKSKLGSDTCEDGWLDFWLREIASSAGFSGSDAWSTFIGVIRSGDVRPIVLVDGLEEVLTDPGTIKAHAAALLSLLREVPLRLREEAGRPLGLLFLVRADMIEAVVAQNVAQFRAGYANYALNWRDSDIKELVVWMATNSGAVEKMWNPDWRLKSGDQQEADLRRIWGRKLGNDDSREARTTEWVIAVLTDLTGRLIARDLVRFIGSAAKLSRDKPMSDRLLSPLALKDAVQYTSQKKVEEYPKEVNQLSEIFEKFARHPGFATPFDRSAALSAGLSDQDLEILEKHGVAYQEEGVFEVPELFRVGLQMRRSGARPNIISLTRRARERARA